MSLTAPDIAKKQERKEIADECFGGGRQASQWRRLKELVRDSVSYPMVGNWVGCFAPSCLQVTESFGAPGMTRTCDSLVRSQPAFSNSLIIQVKY
jgi:hypothetical protein